MPKDTLKVIFINGMLDEYLDALNMLSSGDIFQLTFDDIKTLSQNYSRSKMRKDNSIKDIGVIGEHKSKSNSVFVKGEISNLLESFKTDILFAFSSSLDQFIAVKNKVEVEIFLFVYFPKYGKRHAQNECPLNKIGICSIF